MFLDTPEVIIKTCTTLNLASLMATGPEVSCFCEQVISQNYTSRQVISDLSLQGPEEEWFTNESAFVQEEHQKADCAVVSTTDHQSKAFPQGPQKATANNSSLVNDIRKKQKVK